MYKYLIYFFTLCFFICFLIIFCNSIIAFEGNKIFYFLFSVIVLSTLIFSFRQNSFFFEKYILAYLFLGFWLKFSLYLAFFQNNIFGGAENFEFTEKNLNHLMILSSVPFLSISTASFLSNKIFFLKNYIYNKKITDTYNKKRLTVIILFFFIVVFIGLTNYQLGIYQKGLRSSYDLSFLISGAYKWFLLMGSGIIITIIIKLELDSKKKIGSMIYFLVLFESFFLNISLLSRAMIFNLSSIFFGIHVGFLKCKKYIYLNKSYFFITIIISLLLFLLSNLLVNDLRQQKYFAKKFILKKYLKDTCLQNEELYMSNVQCENANKNLIVKNNEQMSLLNNEDTNINQPFKLKLKKIAQLIYIRFVGIESVMAVQAYGYNNDLNFGNLKEAFNEKIDYSDFNHYYKKYVLAFWENGNQRFDLDKESLQPLQYTIHLPGIVAFLLYPGSLPFLFGSMLFLSILFILLEKFVLFSSGNNLILASFISHLIAYRFAHFGYVPSQSYLFFGSLIFSICAIFFIFKFYK